MGWCVVSDVLGRGRWHLGAKLGNFGEMGEGIFIFLGVRGGDFGVEGMGVAGGMGGLQWWVGGMLGEG